ncbi:MAG: hypothetical protein NT075_15230 [Chloroflexi bacterium]|nr:hypothetical protein [Chloroflexota bacterium]
MQKAGQSAEAMRGRGMVVGTANALADQLGKLAGVGIQRVMLQWTDLDDIAGLEALAKAVL